MPDISDERVRDIMRLAEEMHERGVGTDHYRTSTVAALAREVLDLRATLTATEARLAEALSQRDPAVALLRYAASCAGDERADIEQRLATLTGEG